MIPRCVGLAFLLAGCGSSPPPTSDASTTSDVPVDVPVTADVPVAADVPTGSCTPTETFAPPTGRIAPGTITATIVDPDGAPLANLLAMVCGTDLCSAPARTDASGRVTITFATAVLRPVLTFGDALHTGRFVVPIAAPGAALGTLRTVALPAAGAALTAGTSATSGPLTLTLATGSTVAVDSLTYSTPAEQQLRAAAIPVALAPVDPSVGLELVIATAPQQTLFCPRARARVANTAGWAANAAVDFYALGDDVGQSWAPYGRWHVISAGHVTADGAAIETDPGAGLPVLTTLGLRRR